MDEGSAEDCVGPADGSGEFGDIGHGWNDMQRWRLEKGTVPLDVVTSHRPHDGRRGLRGLGIKRWDDEWHGREGDLYFGTRIQKPEMNFL